MDAQTYLPAAIDVLARVVAAFGFSAGLEGVAASVEALQTLARDDFVLVERLVAIRQVLTPTGDWVREDRQAEQLEQRRLEEQQAEQQRREQDERLAAESTARNASLARLRAKKLALGLDPSVARLPVLVHAPEPLVAAREGDRVRLRVDVRYSRRRRWFFNDKPVADDVDDTMRTGATACTLTLPRLSKRVAGEYYCVCENEEGSAVTPVTRVELVTKLRAGRIAERKLSLLQQHSRPTVVTVDGGGDSRREAVAMCVAAESASGSGGASFGVALLDAETLAPVRLAPSIQSESGKTVVAWSDRTQTLAVVAVAVPSDASAGRKPGGKAVKPGGAVQVALYAFERSAVAAAGQAPPNARGPSYRGALSPSSSPSPPRVKAGAPGANTTTVRQLTNQTVALAATFSGGVRAAAFLDGGRLLAVTDLHLSVAILALEPSQTLRLLHTIRSADDDRIASIASSADAPVLALAFRNSPHVDTVRLAKPSSASGGRTSDRLALARTRRHQFALAVHLTAVDGAGTFAAVAESAGCLKTWISVTNLNTRAINDNTDADADADFNADTPLRPRRRFGAHVGAITGLQWTESSSLLLSSGLDGFVRVWDVVPFVLASRSGGASLLAEFHVGDSVLGMAFASETSTFVTVSKAARGAKHSTVQSHTLPLLKELEAFRREQQLGEAAAQVQKVWKGHQTRVLLAELLGESRKQRRSSVGKAS